MKNKQERKTNKIELDKYYTPVETAKYCIDKTFEIIGRENITEIIEPSAGAGSFSLQIENCIAYDIKPEHPSIIEQDYLKLELEYKKGRLIIGNPPFGTNTLLQSFYKKSIKECDYISFILPISQLNNSNSLYDFDLIYSEDIGNTLYSNMPVHCCLNIYKRPLSGLNKKIIQELKDIEIIQHRRSEKENLLNCDLRICAFGSSIGKVSEYPDQYCKEYLINIKNEKLRNKIINAIKNANWNKEYLMTKSPSLTRWQVIKYLKKMIPEIQ